jgi:hypothetical protein
MGAFVRTLAARFAGVEARGPKSPAPAAVSASPSPAPPRSAAPTAPPVASSGESVIIDIDEPLPRTRADDDSDVYVSILAPAD